MLRSKFSVPGRNDAAIRPHRVSVFPGKYRIFVDKPFREQSAVTVPAPGPGVYSNSRSAATSASVCSGRPTEIRMQLSSPRLS